MVPIPCGSCTWSISENREEEFCRASLVKDGFWHWRDYLFGYHAKRRYPYHYIRLIVTGISDTKKALVFLKQHFGDSSFQQTKDRLKL